MNAAQPQPPAEGAGSIGHQRLQRLMKRGTELLGCEIAFMGGAMSWISERNLVSAISNAGGFGVIACGAMSPELLDTEIKETRKRTDRPFGVNLITMHPDLMALIDEDETELAVRVLHTAYGLDAPDVAA